MNAYIRFILRFRWPILALLAMLTATAAWSMSQGVVASSLGRMFLSDHPGYESYLERSGDFGNNDVIIAAVEHHDMLSEDFLGRLEQISSDIEEYVGDGRVRSILDVQHIDGQGDDLVVHRYADEAVRAPDNRATLLDKMAQDPFVQGLFVSKDGKCTAMVVELDTSKDLPAEKGPVLINRIYEAFAAAGFQRDTVHVVGLPTTVSTIVQETNFNLGRLFPVVCVVLLIAVWVMFRRFWPVIISMTVAFMSVIWTMGFAVLIDRQISILASMIPGVILIISFSDVIHLCSAYLLELGQGLSRRKAIMAAGADVGAACLLTSVTTFAGFVCLSLVPTPVFRQLGFSLAFGVSVALIIAVTLVPILWSLMPRPKPWNTGATGRIQDLLDRLLAGMSGVTTRRPRLVILLFAVLSVAAAWGVSNLTIETDMAKRLPEDHKLRMDGDWFRERFSGANMLDVYIEAPEGEDLLDAKRFAAIARFQDAVKDLEGVDRVHSLVDLMETIHTEFAGGGGEGQRLPDTRQALAQYLLLFEMAGGEDLDRLVGFNRRTMRMTVHLPGEGVMHTRDTGRKLEEIAPTDSDSHAAVEATGLAFLMGDWLDSIVEGQQKGLGLAVFLISIMMILGLRSWKVGLWSMIPNLLPLVVLGGYLGWTWDHVDSDLLGLAMIAIGIGVDDTVHFLVRFRIEVRRAPDIAEAIRRTFHFSGRGIVITTVILVTGFAPFAMSNYLSLAVMGTLLPMTLIVALMADLFLVAAMVRMGIIRFGR